MKRITEKPAGIVFDLDGTLLNTIDDLADAVNEALDQFHYPKRTLEEVRSFVGNGVEVLMKRACPEDISSSRFNDCLKHFKDYYESHLLVKTKPYEGILEMLATLKAEKIIMAIVSNKIDSAVKDLMTLFFQDFISIGIGDRKGLALKPNPDSVYEAIKQMGLHENDLILYIGDSETDVKTAQNAGLPFIGVSWGFRTFEELKRAGAEVIVKNPEELVLKIIKKRGL